MSRVYVDLDGVVADYDMMIRSLGVTDTDYQKIDGAYLWLPVYPGAEAGVRALIKEFGRENFFFLSKPPEDRPYAWAEKVMWVKQHFPDLEDRIIITFDKSACGDVYDFIIDDRPHKGNVENFKGDIIHFGSDQFPDWSAIVRYLTEVNNFGKWDKPCGDYS